MDNLFFRLAVVCLLGCLGVLAGKELRKPDTEAYRTEREPALRASGELEDGQEMKVPAVR